MRKVLFILLFVLIAAVSMPHAGPRKKKRVIPVLALNTVQTPADAPAGEAIELLVTVAPPEGIKLNRYPGITLTIEKAKGLKLTNSEAFVGEKKPLTNPDEFGFKTIDPLKFSLVAKSSGSKQRYLEGTLKFFYCVKKSGYCAPGTQAVKIPVKTH